MKDTDVIKFCIAQNLAESLGLEKKGEIIWRLFLAMDIMGFQYNGLKSSKYEIFNGLNGTCRDFVDRCFGFFGLFKHIVDYRELSSYDYKKNLVIEVDDFYLKYHPYFNKYHHIRYILLTGINHDVGMLYDMGMYEMNLDIIKQAVSGAFSVGGREEMISNIEYTTNNLVEYYENKNWADNAGSITFISYFRKDLEEKALSLTQTDFESLYYFVNKLGGPTQTRKFMYIALTSLLEYIGNSSNKLTLIKDILGKSAYEWDILGNLFFKMSRSFKVEMYERILKRLDRIVDLEMQLENL